MESMSFGDVKRLMVQYNLKVYSDSINEDLTCTMCKKLVVDAYQTYCDCKYCRACIDVCMAGRDKYCLGRKKECKEEYLVFEKSVTKNVLLDRKVLKAKVHCPNKSCTCITELSQLERHMRECTQNLMECPFTFLGCDAESAPKEVISIHIRDDTLTHSQLLIELIHNLKNEIRGLREDFGLSKLEISTLKEELRMKDVEIKDLKGEITEQKRKTDTQDREMASLKRESLKGESSATVTQSMNDVRVRVDKLENTIEKMNVQANTKVGSLSFTMEKFSAKKMIEDVIHSPYFYSHTNGYKLRLRLDPGGSGDGRGTHLSVYIQICQGEFDDVLPWPCRYAFILSVTNQRHGGTHASWTHGYTTTPNNLRQTFDKPINKDNVALGNSKLISHADLKSVVGLIVDDSVIVRCLACAPT